MAAANVEDALAEIYTDTASAISIAGNLDENPDITSGLTWGYKSGIVRSDTIITAVTGSTIGLTDNSTNYIEVDAAGTVSKNTTRFTQAKIPLRQITTLGGVQVSSVDKRSFMFNFGIRTMEFLIETGTDVNTIKLRGRARFNCTDIASEDKIGKGTTGTNFTLDATGSILRISPTALTVTTPECLTTSIFYCTTGTVTICSAQGTTAPTSAMLVGFRDFSGNQLDLTSELAGTKYIYCSTTYIDLGY
uniref:Uncharacterized protein n=1 Tax=viral metagenome TaxID=1070528 RepID=A0A6M3XYA2_9ZZZZ